MSKNNKEVIITGINGGIGSELGKEFLRNGWGVVGLDIQDSSGVIGDNSRFTYYQIDLTNSDRLKELNKHMILNHQVETVIHNAGISQIKFFDQQTDEDFEAILAINLTCIVQSTRFWLSHFNQNNQEGTIVNISSVAGSVPTSKLVHYGTTKFALTGFTQSLQLEKKENNWRTNILLVSPGFVKTPLMKIGEADGFPKSLEYLVSDPTDCAKAIYKGILKKEEHIIPNLAAQTLLGARRLSPKITNYLQSWALKKK